MAFLSGLATILIELLTEYAAHAALNALGAIATHIKSSINSLINTVAHDLFERTVNFIVKKVKNISYRIRHSFNKLCYNCISYSRRKRRHRIKR